MKDFYTKIVYNAERSRQETVTTYEVQINGETVYHIHTDKDLDILATDVGIMIHKEKKQ